VLSKHGWSHGFTIEFDHDRPWRESQVAEEDL